MICYGSATAAGVIFSNDPDLGIAKGARDGKFSVVVATDGLHMLDDSEQCKLWRK